MHVSAVRVVLRRRGRDGRVDPVVVEAVRVTLRRRSSARLSLGADLARRLEVGEGARPRRAAVLDLGLGRDAVERVVDVARVDGRVRAVRLERLQPVERVELVPVF